MIGLGALEAVACWASSIELLLTNACVLVTTISASGGDYGDYGDVDVDVSAFMAGADDGDDGASTITATTAAE